MRVNPCFEKESRWRDSPPAACRFSDVIPYAAVRSPGGFCCIGNAVSYTIIKSPARRTLPPERGRFSGHISLARSAIPRRVLLHRERSFLYNKNYNRYREEMSRILCSLPVPAVLPHLFHYDLTYLVTMSTGTLKIFATFRMVSICLPVAAAK